MSESSPGTAEALVIEALVIRPGDTLLLRLAPNITERQFEALRERLMPTMSARLPGVEVIMLGGVEQMAVSRPEQPTEDDPA